jgi:hypothetical protein
VAAGGRVELKKKPASSGITRGVAVGLVGLAALAGVVPGCAHRIGQKAAEGAVAELQKQQEKAAEEHPDKVPARIAGEAAVKGAVSALDAPDQREAIQRLVAEAVSVATTTAVQNAAKMMIAELGPDGQGPLAVSLSRTGERVSASVVGSAGNQLADLLPECSGPDRMDCINRRLQQTARSTAASFTSGIKDTIGWHLLLIVFVLGAAGGVLGAWLWSLRPLRRRTFRTA